MMGETTESIHTPLFGLHQELGGRMVEFAGHALPVQYEAGVMKEHLICRTAAALFDVSHMGQVRVRARSGNVDDAARALERLIPVDVVGLKTDRQRYGFFINDRGGIIDDLMIARRTDHMALVVNASRKAVDLAHMRAGLSDCEVEEVADRALVALQGPGAEAIMGSLVPGAQSMRFMDVIDVDSPFGVLVVARAGYTGEDGYEVSVKADNAEAFARALLDAGAAPAGLGARDSLRLEAGLCLYGNDIDEGTTPVEADLTWAIQKVRRGGGDRAGGFPGADVVLAQIADGPARRRVGLAPDGRAPMRGGTLMFASEDADAPVGNVTSGAFGPSLGTPVAMGYVTAQCSAPRTQLWGEVRGKRMPARVAPLPFHQHSYKR